MQGKCKIYNYADGNTIVFSHSNINVLKEPLTQPIETAIRWLNQITCEPIHNNFKR